MPGVVATPGPAKAEDIFASGVLLVDLDEGHIPAKQAHLVRHIGPPSLVVASGGRSGDGHDKLHLFWRLTEADLGIETDAWTVNPAQG